MHSSMPAAAYLRGIPKRGAPTSRWGGPRLLARRRRRPLPRWGLCAASVVLGTHQSTCLAAAAPNMAGYPPPAADYPPPPPSGAPPPGYPAAGVPVGGNGTNEKGYPYGEFNSLIKCPSIHWWLSAGSRHPLPAPWSCMLPGISAAAALVAVPPPTRVHLPHRSLHLAPCRLSAPGLPPARLRRPPARCARHSRESCCRGARLLHRPPPTQPVAAALLPPLSQINGLILLLLLLQATTALPPATSSSLSRCTSSRAGRAPAPTPAAPPAWRPSAAAASLTA